MRRFYQGVVDHPRLIIDLFVLALAVSLACWDSIKVNYDMTDYLPPETASSVALDTMESEFDGAIPNARVMVAVDGVAEALEYKARIAAVDGVSDVTWLDDAVKITQPESFMDQNALDTYYQDGYALFSVSIERAKRISAVTAIREIVGDESCMAGSAVTTAVATESTVQEIPVAAALGIAFALFVLILTTTSFAEPFIVLIGLGVAVLINAGTNIVFGEISFVTNAAGKILQLAVSLDYSVFLLHRFEECRREAPDAKTAMVDALCASTSSILASGLTTVIGFLALVLMQYRIGPDLGLALAKGIAISLVTVFTFMPCFVLATYRLIDRTRHRRFLPSFRGFGRFVCAAMIPFFCLFALLVVPSWRASNANDFYYGASHIFGVETKLGQDVAKIEKVFGKSDTYVLMVPRTSTANEQAVSDELHELTAVRSVVSYVDSVGVTIPESYLDSATAAKLSSESHTRLVITVKADYEGEETYDLVGTIRSIAERYYPGEWLLAGEGVSTVDMRDTVTADMLKVNLIAIAAVFVVLLLTMKSLTLPVFLVLGIETAIWVGLSVPYFADQTIFYLVYLIISSIQLGATVDYAILFTNRYLEFRRTMAKKAAIVETVSATTASIMTSGSVLTVVGLLLGAFSTHGVIAQLGTFLGRGTLCSLAVVLFALPGMLYLFDGLIAATTYKSGFLKVRRPQDELPPVAPARRGDALGAACESTEREGRPEAEAEGQRVAETRPAAEVPPESETQPEPEVQPDPEALPESAASPDDRVSQAQREVQDQLEELLRMMEEFEPADGTKTNGSGGAAGAGSAETSKE